MLKVALVLLPGSVVSLVMHFLEIAFFCTPETRTLCLTALSMAFVFFVGGYFRVEYEHVAASCARQQRIR